MAFDETDVSILRELRRDARRSVVLLARSLSMPVSTVHDRLTRLKRQGIRFTALFDWSGLGCSLTVCLVVPYDATLADHPNVNTCVRVSPDALLVECVFASFLELESFQQRIPHARVYPVIETLKKEGFVPEPNGV